jgi:hypothetical protein
MTLAGLFGVAIMPCFTPWAGVKTRATKLVVILAAVAVLAIPTAATAKKSESYYQLVSRVRLIVQRRFHAYVMPSCGGLPQHGAMVFQNRTYYHRIFCAFYGLDSLNRQLGVIYTQTGEYDYMFTEYGPTGFS